MASYSNKQVMSLKLVIDTKNNKVLFAEAGKDFVDFLFTLLTLPAGTFTRLLTAESMVGSIGNIYGSVENLRDTYMQQNLSKEVLLKPEAVFSSKEVPLLLPGDVSAVKKVYLCGRHHRYVADDPEAICPRCRRTISTEAEFVSPEVAEDGSSGKEGYVKGAVTYMVMDDLVVTALSTVSVISLLKKYDVTNVEEKVVSFGIDQGLEFLKESLQSKTILTSIFLGKKEATFVSNGLKGSSKFSGGEEDGKKDAAYVPYGLNKSSKLIKEEEEEVPSDIGGAMI